MKFYINLRYLIVPISSLVTILGIILGSIYAWAGVFLFGIYTIIDTLTRNIHLRAEADEDGESYGIKQFQYSVMSHNTCTSCFILSFSCMALICSSNCLMPVQS